MTLDDLVAVTGLVRSTIRGRISQMDNVAGFYDSNGNYSYKFNSSSDKISTVSSLGNSFEPPKSLDEKGRAGEAKPSFDVELKTLKNFFQEYGDCKHLKKFMLVTRIPNTDIVINQCGVCNKTMDKIYTGVKN
mgnify:CR=1 FL=1